MRRVRAEINIRYQTQGSKENPILILPCATSRDLPDKHNDCIPVVCQTKASYLS